MPLQMIHSKLRTLLAVPLYYGLLIRRCLAAQWRFAESIIPIIRCFVLPVVLGSTASYMHYSNPSWRERRGHAPASEPCMHFRMALYCQRLHALGSVSPDILHAQ